MKCRKISASAIRKEIRRMKKVHPTAWRRVKADVKQKCGRFSEKMVIDYALGKVQKDYERLELGCPSAGALFEVAIETPEHGMCKYGRKKK